MHGFDLSPATRPRRSRRTFMGFDTRTPYMAAFDSDDSGKAVWYILQWESTTGEPGHLGQVFATVAP